MTEPAKASHKVRFKRNVSLVQKIVLVDGVTRTGKSMLGPIMSAMQGVEIERVEAVFEYIPMLYSMGHITRDAAVDFIQLEADTKLYESFIGRNTNFRYTDHSSVFNCPDKLKYFKRLFKKDVASAPSQIMDQGIVFQVQTHDTLGMIDIYFDAFGENVYVLEMVRDPVDLIYSWHMRGWGHRFTSDPLALTFTIETEDGIAPWYHSLLAEPVKPDAPADNIICMIEALLKRNFDKYTELEPWMKKQVHWIIFEDFVTRPHEHIPRIEKFIGIKASGALQSQLKKERCPRVLKEEDRRAKFKIIKEKASPEAVEKIDGLYEMYQKVKEIISSEQL
jgi:hypothetical protein